MANVDKLLHGAPGGVDLFAQLELKPHENAELQSAKAKIREYLKFAIAEGTKRLLGTAIEPRFFTQGSDAYKTLNRPAWLPPQRMDLDDGTYLPMTFVQGAKPSTAASAFFTIVDNALRDLVRREKWKDFKEKDTCARVILNERAHVDVPLYAIPDAEFTRLTKAAMQRMAKDSAFDFMDSRVDSRDSWDELPSEKVLLAHRKEDWKVSDPRKVHEWFLAAIRFYGELLRRECRYLKAWRDHQRLDHISSIILMVDAWSIFEEVGHLSVPRRDDLALLAIAERLPRLFAGSVENPADPGEMLGSKWSPEQRQAAIDAASRMQEELDMAINHCYDGDIAVRRLRAVFGDRIPYRPDLVGVHSAAAAVIAATPALIVPAPAVGRSTSG